ncbi:MAG: hypothetical protein AAB638_03350, partial [Patescibacteria group bacterium]
MESKTTVLPGVFGLIKQSLAFYKKNFKNLVLIGLVLIIVSILSFIIIAFIFNFVSSKNVALAIIMAILFFVVIVVNIVLQYVAKLAFIKASIEYDALRFPSVKELYKIGFRFFWPSIWVAILVGLVFFGASIFLIIPGIV